MKRKALMVIFTILVFSTINCKGTGNQNNSNSAAAGHRVSSAFSEPLPEFEQRFTANGDRLEVGSEFILEVGVKTRSGDSVDLSLQLPEGLSIQDKKLIENTVSTVKNEWNSISYDIKVLKEGVHTIDVQFSTMIKGKNQIKGNRKLTVNTGENSVTHTIPELLSGNLVPVRRTEVSSTQTGGVGGVAEIGEPEK